LKGVHRHCPAQLKTWRRWLLLLLTLSLLPGEINSHMNFVSNNTNTGLSLRKPYYNELISQRVLLSLSQSF
jgi:hypothetical protein